MKIRFTGRARKDAKGLDLRTQKRIRTKLEWYMSHDDPLVFADTLTDSDLGQYRFRIGDFRLPFDVVGDTIRINRIGHRREIYQ